MRTQPGSRAPPSHAAHQLNCAQGLNGPSEIDSPFNLHTIQTHSPRARRISATPAPRPRTRITLRAAPFRRPRRTGSEPASVLRRRNRVGSRGTIWRSRRGRLYGEARGGGLDLPAEQKDAEIASGGARFGGKAAWEGGSRLRLGLGSGARGRRGTLLLRVGCV